MVRGPQHHPDEDPQVEGSTAPPRHDRAAPHVGELQEGSRALALARAASSRWPVWPGVNALSARVRARA